MIDGVLARTWLRRHLIERNILQNLFRQSLHFFPFLLLPRLRRVRSCGESRDPLHKSANLRARLKNPEQHRPRQPACIGVLQRWMIAGNRDQPARQPIFCAMRELKTRARFQISCPHFVRQQPVKCNPPQAHHHAQFVSSLNSSSSQARNCVALRSSACCPAERSALPS